MSLPTTHRDSAKVAIMRLGRLCTITEPTLGATDGYGKPDPDAETWSSVGEEHVARSYTRSTAPDQTRTTGGRYRTESPLLMFSHDSVVKEGFRVTYDTEMYEVDAITTYPTHLEATTTLVQQ
jgi:hypothetical protein